MKTSMSLLVGTLILATASAWAAAPKARPGGALAMFAGTWESHGSFTAADANKSTHVRGRNVCKWSDGAHLFLVCNGVAHVEGMAAPQHQLSVYTYDAASGKYRFAGITPNEDVATPNFGLKGNTGRIPASSPARTATPTGSARSTFSIHPIGIASSSSPAMTANTGPPPAAASAPGHNRARVNAAGAREARSWTR